MRLTKPRSSPGVKTHEKPGIFFSLAKCGTGPLLILKMGMFFQREHKGFLLACALKNFLKLDLNRLFLYSMAGGHSAKEKIKGFGRASSSVIYEKNSAFFFVVVVPIIIAIVIVLHTDDGRNPAPPEI